MPDPVTITPVPDRPVPRPPEPIIPERVDRPQRPPVDLNFKEYRVRAGDVLSRIASRTGVSLAEIMELNKISDPDKIYEGQTLLLPPHAEIDAPAPPPRDDRPARPVPAEGLQHEVQPGEALSIIAQRYGVSVRDIVRANNLSDADTIRVGQKLLIPGVQQDAPRPRTPERRPAPELPDVPETPAPPVLPDPESPFSERETRVRDTRSPAVDEEMEALIQRSGDMIHVVDQGQSLEDIARMYGVRAEDIQRANALASRHVMTGQTLIIPRD